MMGWGQHLTPRQDADLLDNLADQNARLLDAYGQLWHRYGAIVKRARDLVHDIGDRRDLPSPHELLTGQTRDDVIAAFRAAACPDEVTE